MFRTFLQIISRRVRTDLHLPDRDDANNASDASAGAA
jgi:hypothetical protein